MPSIDALITKVERDQNGWVRVSTDHDTVKRLDTKDPDRARQANELFQSGQRAIIQYTSRPRTLDDGRVFQNYYFDSAMTATNGGGQQQQGLDGIPMAAQQQQAAPAGRSNDAEAWRIALSVGAKLAVETLPSLLANPGLSNDDVSFPGQSKIALAWATWIFTTPQPTPGTSASSQRGAYSYDEPPPPDDDIPF